MSTFLTVIALVIAGVIAVVFLNRFYRKATRERALIRTGFGGENFEGPNTLTT